EAVVLAHEQDDDRPQCPDREADVLGQHGEPEVPARDLLAGRLPELLVLRLPVLDPVLSLVCHGVLLSAGRVGHCAASQLAMPPTASAHPPQPVVARVARASAGVSVAPAFHASTSRPLVT